MFKYMKENSRLEGLKSRSCWAWEHMPMISAFGRLKHEDFKFEANLGYIMSSRPACATE
jgi:hypothetical protein